MSNAQQVVSAFIAAVEAKDLDAAVAMVHPDVSYENVPIQPIVGREAVRAALGAFLGAASRVEWVVTRSVESANVSGPGVVFNERVDRFELGNGWLELPVAGIFEVDGDGLITLWRDYFDMATYTNQLAALTDAG